VSPNSLYLAAMKLTTVESNEVKVNDLKLHCYRWKVTPTWMTPLQLKVP